MKWFRLYHDIPNDRKLRKFSSEQKWAWIVLLCLASESKQRGMILGEDDDDLADYCGFNSTQDYLFFLDKLRQKGMINPVKGGIEIANWEVRQYINPSDKPEATRERKRRQREKEKEKREEGNNGATPVTTIDLAEKKDQCHGVTSRDFLVTARDVTTTDTDPERSFTSVSDLQIADPDPETDSNPELEPDPEKEKDLNFARSSLNLDTKRKENEAFGSFQNPLGGSKLLGQAEISEEMQKSGEISEITFSVNPQRRKSEALGSKKKRVTVPRAILEQFLEHYNQHAPPNWSRCAKLTDSRLRSLTKFCKEHGEDSSQIFQDALAYASLDSWCLNHNLTFENFMTNNKPVQWAEKYRSGYMQVPKEQESYAQVYSIARDLGYV